MVYEITTLFAFQFILIFLRIGTAMMLMTGFGEAFVSPRIRLTLALLVSAVLQPALADSLPAMPASAWAMGLMVLAEIIIGAFIGGICRTLQAIMHIAGMLFAMQSSMATAVLFDPSQETQGSVVGNFLSLLAITVLFSIDAHHLLLQGLAQSYDMFTPGMFANTGDMADVTLRTVADVFTVAFKIASPMLIIGLVMYLGLGIMARLMPNMHVFFVIIPLQLLIGFMILMFTLSFSIMFYVNYYQDTYTNIFGG